jgi:hypothetical protein
MIIKVAIIVYDRLHNIEEWIRCYKQADTKDAELVIIHNYKDETDKIKLRELCKKNDVKYVSRTNTGFDIGAFQDVCKERLPGFPNDWDYLFWATDDTIPMYKKFIPRFLEAIQKPNVGVACLEISLQIKKHIRTSGFMLSKETSKKLEFPVDPIITKAHCYQFEHRSTTAFYEQIINMGKQVVQVSPTLMVSHLWDTNSRRKLNRWPAHYREFRN